MVLMQQVDAVIARSCEFADHLGELLAAADGFESSPRAQACGFACELSLEHAHAVRTLFVAEAPNSACAMLRAQYEGVVRAAWALYAANDEQVEKLNQPLTAEAVKSAANLPGAKDMLTALQRRLDQEPGLRGLVLPLTEIHTVSWRAMNSFVHGGLLPLQRTSDGFPAKLAIDILRTSNGTVHIAARLLARLTPHEALAREIDQAWQSFKDCLPVVQAPT